MRLLSVNIHSFGPLPTLLRHGALIPLLGDSSLAGYSLLAARLETCVVYIIDGIDDSGSFTENRAKGRCWEHDTARHGTARSRPYFVSP